MADGVLAAKRRKLVSQNDATVNVDDQIRLSKSLTVKAILSDEYYEPIKRCFVCVGIVNDIKSISKAMKELCQQMPLNNLNHLKRVNKSKIILCSLYEMAEFFQQNHEQQSVKSVLSTLNTQSSQLTEDKLRMFDEESIISLMKCFLKNRNLSDSLIDLLSERMEFTAVAAYPPILSWQYSDVIKDWPCKFHPNKHLDKLYAGEWFTNDETAFHIEMIEICELLRHQLHKNASGIAVDPRTKSIVAVGFDEMNKHPLMHCAMVLIDAVARSQKGGAWNDYLKEENNQSDAIYSTNSIESDEYTLSGVSLRVRNLILSKFPSIKFGAESVKSVDENRQNYMNMDANCDNLAKYGPYLGTGYDVYLWREPCVMCSMAFTHSRIRTIFFHEANATNGAISSIAKLQSIKSLNHHFQVFHITNS